MFMHLTALVQAQNRGCVEAPGPHGLGSPLHPPMPCTRERRMTLRAGRLMPAAKVEVAQITRMAPHLQAQQACQACTCVTSGTRVIYIQ